MWPRKITPSTKLGFTLKADKRCNKWFNCTYEEWLTKMNGHVNELATKLDDLDFKMELIDLGQTAAHTQQVITVPKMFIRPNLSTYPQLETIERMYPGAKANQRFILTWDTKIESTYALKGTAKSLL